MLAETKNVYEYLMDNVAITTQIGYKARFIRFNGKIMMIPEYEFMTLAYVLGFMFKRMQFDNCVFELGSLTPIEYRIRDLNNGKISEHHLPAALLRKLAKRGILTFSRHTEPGKRNVFADVVSMNGSVSISDHGILCIGE